MPRVDRRLLPILVSLMCAGGSNVTSGQCEIGQCRRGQYRDVGTNACLPCPNDTYMLQDLHNCTACLPCSTHDVNQTLLTPCTLESDAVVGCPPGYFSPPLDHGSFCSPCTACRPDQSVARLCEDHSDTVCGEKPAPFILPAPDVDAGRSRNWLKVLIGISIPGVATVLFIALISLNRVASIRRKLMCRSHIQDDEVSIIDVNEMYKKRRERLKKQPEKEKSKNEEPAVLTVEVS